MYFSKEYFDDNLNPILLKEVHYLVRAPFFWVFVLLYLILLAAAACCPFLRPDYLDGASAVKAIITLLMICSIVVTSSYIENKICKDPENGTDELLVITTLSIESFAKGEFYLAAIMATFFHCSSIPFLLLLFICNDIEFGIILSGFMLSYAQSLAILIVFVILKMVESQKNSFMRGFINLVSEAGLGISFIVALCLSIMCLEGRILSSFLQVILCASVESIFAFGMHNLCLGSFKMQMPTKDFVTVRFGTTFVWLFFLILCFMGNHLTMLGCVGIIIIIIIATCIIHSEPEVYFADKSNQDKSDVMIKTLKFPFITGFVNGFIWIVAMTIFSVIVLGIISGIKSSDSNIVAHFPSIIFITMATMNAYLLIGNIIRKAFLNKHEKAITILCGAVAYFCFACIPAIITKYSNAKVVDFENGSVMRYYEKNIPAVGFPGFVECLNPLLSIYTQNYGIAIFGAILLLAVGILLNIKTLYQQILDYYQEVYHENKA